MAGSKEPQVIVEHSELLSSPFSISNDLVEVHQTSEPYVHGVCDDFLTIDFKIQLEFEPKTILESYPNVAFFSDIVIFSNLPITGFAP